MGGWDSRHRATDELDALGAQSGGLFAAGTRLLILLFCMLFCLLVWLGALWALNAWLHIL